MIPLRHNTAPPHLCSEAYGAWAQGLYSRHTVLSSLRERAAVDPIWCHIIALPGSAHNAGQHAVNIPHVVIRPTDCMLQHKNISKFELNIIFK